MGSGKVRRVHKEHIVHIFTSLPALGCHEAKATLHCGGQAHRLGADLTGL